MPDASNNPADADTIALMVLDDDGAPPLDQTSDSER